MPNVRWGLATDSGRIRPENEDNALADQRVFIVADGMGGHRAGEVAAAIAVDLLRARLSAPGATLDDVVAAIAEANADIFGAANDNPDQHGMGTTVTGLVLVHDPFDESGADDDPGAADTSATATAAEHDVDGGEAPAPAPDADDGAATSWALVNVGDSRTYLLRHGRMRRVTIDHSYVQELIATGHITDDEARTHPRRNIVTRALGIDPSVRVDAWTLPVVRGDRFLVCSDGLVDEVRDADIANVITTVGDPQAAADELVALANREGGRDNITVIVVDVLEGDDPPDPTSELDLEPAWESGTATSSWAVDDPEGEATEFEDLAALVSGDGDGPPASGSDGTTGDPARPITDEIPVVDGAAPAPRRRRRRVTGFIGGVAVVAILLLALVITAAWARRGYFVAFDDDGDVVIYRGRAEGFLWFEPTEDAPANLNRSQLDDESIARVERESRFDSRSAAEEFVAGQLDTTTTTTTTTTSTVPPTTVLP